MTFGDGLQQELKSAFVNSETEVNTMHFDDSTVTTIRQSHKTIHIKLPRQEHELMEIDALLTDDNQQKRYVAYETELDKKAFNTVLADTLMIVRKFIADDYVTERRRSMLGIKTSSLLFNVDGRSYSFSEA